MKIKNIPLILILILMMSGVFTGCNAVNSAFDSVFLNAPDVRAKDLAGYEGAEPESDEQILAGFAECLSMAFSRQAGLMTNALGESYEDVIYVLGVSMPEFRNQTEAAGSRKSQFTVDFSSDDETVEPKFDASSGSIDPGKLTVENLDIEAVCKVENAAEPETAESDFKLSADIILEDVKEFSWNAGTGSYDLPGSQLNQMSLNIRSRGSMKSVLEEDDSGVFLPVSADFYAAVDISAGLSYSSVSNSYSGKYICSLNWIQSGTLNVDNLAEGELTGNADAPVLTIELYDNDNELLSSSVFSLKQVSDMVQVMNQ